MAFKIFIDGKEGTTGLKIFERFENRKDLEILLIDEDKRKDINERKRLINESDYTFLCLPDAAAIEAVSLCENPNTIIIDASTAHRTNPDWAYGFPELSKEHRHNVETSKRIAAPGCYASGFNALVYPLVKSGILPKDYPVVCHAVSGYSGAGKKAIAQYGDENRDFQLESPRLYALTQEHKHLPEMQKVSGLTFSKGSIGHASCQEICDMFKTHYEGSRFVKVADFMGEDILTEPFIPANTLSGTNNMQIFICGNDERVTITSRFDNLGKGASGAAVQCMNISMGVDEGLGL